MRLRVLVAEDDPVFRALICDIVRQQGYEPVEAGDGREAIRRFFSGTEPNLAILDVMMPLCDGWEVLKEIRAHSDAPVMMLTRAWGRAQRDCRPDARRGRLPCQTLPVRGVRSSP